MNQSRITYKQHYKALLRLGGPIIIGQLGVILQGIADSVMVGHYSTASLSASGFVNHIFNLALVFGMGFSYGLTPIVSRLFSQNKIDKTSQALKNSILANLGIAAIILVCLSALYLNIDKVGQPEELLPLMRPYFLTLLVSIPFMQLFYGYKQFSEGITDTATPMWVMLSGNLLNMVGNYILIFGKLGAPELGLTGAGVATLLSRVYMWLAMVILFNHKRSFAPFKEQYRRVKFTLKGFKRLNKIGWPIALQMGMETASFSLSAVMMGWIGATALAAHQILCAVGTLCFMIYYGIGAAVTIRESRFFGENNLPEVRRTSYAGFHLILIFGTIATSTIFLLRNHIGYMFTDEAAVNTMAVALVLPFIFYQFGDALQCCYANALRGIEDVKIMMLHAFIAYIVISLPASYIFAFPLGYGAVGVWMGFPFGLTSAGLMFLFRFLQKTKTR